MTGSDACGIMSVVWGRIEDGGESPEISVWSDLEGRVCHASIDACCDGISIGFNSDSSCDARVVMDWLATVLGGALVSVDSIVTV